MYDVGMARPQGHPLSPQAWEDVLRLAGLSQTVVAERSGIPRSTLASLLGGHHKASIPMAHKIAEAVGCHPATLFPSIAKPSTSKAA